MECVHLELSSVRKETSLKLFLKNSQFSINIFIHEFYLYTNRLDSKILLTTALLTTNSNIIFNKNHSCWINILWSKAGPIYPRKRERKRFRFRSRPESRSTGPIYPTNEYESIFAFVFVLPVPSIKTAQDENENENTFISLLYSLVQFCNKSILTW